MPADDVTVTVGVNVDPKGVADVEKLNTALTKLDKTKVEPTVDFKVSRALKALDDVADEAKKTKVAADALAKALGPELAGRIDVDAAVRDFQGMDLSLEDITANADKLGGKMRDLSPNFQRVSGAMQEFGGATERTHEAISNMTGEMAGQLSEVAGAEGGAGIAIGNLVELLTSTAIASKGAETGIAALGGQLLAAAGPLAGIAAALFAVNQIMGEMEKGQAATEAFDTEQLKQFNDAIEKGGDVLLNYQAELEKTGEVAVETGAKMGPAWARAIPGVGDVTKALGLLDKFGQDITDIVPQLNRAKISSDEWAAVVTSTEPVAAMDAFRLKVQASNLTLDEQADVLIGARKAQDAYAEQSKKTGDAQTFFAASVKDINDAFEAAKDPLDRFTGKWQILIDDMKDGHLDTQAAADAFAFLEQTLGLTKDQIVKIINQHFADELKDQEQAAKNTDAAIKQMASDLQTFVDNIDRAAQNMFNAQGALDELGGAFEQMSINEGALQAVFTLGDAPLEFLDRVTAIHDGMRDFAKFIGKDLKGKIPNIFDPNDIHAGEFLQKIKSLRDPIQKEINDAFIGAGGGAAGAAAGQQAADMYVDQLFHVLKGKLSRDQIRTLLGLDDLQVKLKVAVDLADKEKAKKELEILTGLRGQNAWTASVSLALEAETISPQAAKVIIERELTKAQVLVPSTLATPDVGKAKSEADRFGAMPSNAVTLGSTVGNPSDKSKVDAQRNGQDYATQHPILWPSQVVPPKPTRLSNIFNLFGADAGGIIPAGSVGLVAERRPEILNERYLAVQPTLVPAGTRVTSGARTARVLRTRGTRGLRRYDAGGTVTAVPVNITINGAALGARYEIMRTVRRAAKDAVRLLGTRT